MANPIAPNAARCTIVSAIRSGGRFSSGMVSAVDAAAEGAAALEGAAVAPGSEEIVVMVPSYDAPDLGNTE